MLHSWGRRRFLVWELVGMDFAKSRPHHGKAAGQCGSGGGDGGNGCGADDDDAVSVTPNTIS